MIRSLRLRFWLLVMDATASGPHWLHLWCLRRASDATDWGEGAKRGEGEPF